MEQNPSLKRWLTSLTATYHEADETVEVRFSDAGQGSYAAQDGEHIGVVVNTAAVFGQAHLADQLDDVDSPEELERALEDLDEEDLAPDLSREDELRIVTDTTSHEVEHINKSILTAKEDFIDEWPEAAELAGMVHNVLEDQYIDRTRTDRFKGLRKAHAFKMRHIMANDALRPPVDTLPRGAAFAEGFLQVAFAGTAKGIEDAPEDLTDFLGWARPRIDAARHADDPTHRDAIAHKVMAKLMEYLPDPEDRQAANSHADASADGNTTDDPGESEHSAEDFDTEDVEEHLKSLSKEDVEDMEVPDDPEEGIEVDPDELDVDEEDLEFEWDDLPSAPGESADESAEDGESEDGGTSGSDDPEDEETDEDGRASGEDAEDADEEEGGAGDEEDDPEGEGHEDAETGTGEPSDHGNAPTGVGDSPGPDPTPDPEAHIEEMEAQTDKEDHGIGEWHGLTDDVEYMDPGERWERRMDKLDQRELERQTPMGQRKEDRDERRRTGTGHTKTQKHLDETGLAREITDAFRRLRTRDVEVPTDHGDHIHVDNAIQHLSGDYTKTDVYKRRRRIEVGDRVVHVSVDMSGSMSTHAIRVGLAALHLATHEIGDTLAASGFTGSNRTPLIKAWDEEWSWDLLNAVSAGGSTPLPAGLLDGIEMLKDTPNRERVLIVITDGRPNTSLKGGDASAEAATLVREANMDGIKVIGIGMSGVSESGMAQIFGEDGYVMADMDTLAERLVEVYRRQMDLVKEIR